VSAAFQVIFVSAARIWWPGAGEAAAWWLPGWSGRSGVFLAGGWAVAASEAVRGGFSWPVLAGLASA
jgi:hypothetical protein